ncbi:MAG: hypothetical protein F9K24_20765 [Leptonema illini]|uniref:Uncharacterized protein n=1 Tax=Leptonema illini TaxID=183 RepID=A0A833GXK5_9LEPT|nr:MAG: hypothetical protein F9K24_20765 [Leptonema illini]
MKPKFIVFGLIMILAGLALRAASYVMQYAPTEAAILGQTLPLDWSTAVVGFVSLLLGIDPDLLRERASGLYNAYAEIRRERREKRRGGNHV